MAKLNFANDKSWYESKTLWINGIVILLGISLAVLEEYQTGVPITAIGIINTALRFLTKEGIINPMN